MTRTIGHPQLPVGIEILGGVVILGVDNPDAEQRPGVSDADPLVLEVAGPADAASIANSPLPPRRTIHVETGTQTVTLTRVLAALVLLA